MDQARSLREMELLLEDRVVAARIEGRREQEVEASRLMIEERVRWADESSLAAMRAREQEKAIKGERDGLMKERDGLMKEREVKEARWKEREDLMSARINQLIIQTEIEEARNQSLASQLEAEEARNQSLASQLEAEEARNQSLASQLEAEEARNQSLASQLEAEEQRSQLLASQLEAEEARSQSLASQLEFEEQRTQSYYRSTIETSEMELTLWKDRSIAAESEIKSLSEAISGIRSLLEISESKESFLASELDEARALLKASRRATNEAVRALELSNEWESEGGEVKARPTLTHDPRSTSADDLEELDSLRHLLAQKCDEVVIKEKSLDWLEGQVLSLQGLMMERDRRVRELEGLVGDTDRGDGGLTRAGGDGGLTRAGGDGGLTRGGWRAVEVGGLEREDEGDGGEGCSEVESEDVMAHVDQSAALLLPSPSPSPVGKSSSRLVWRQVKVNNEPPPQPAAQHMQGSAGQMRGVSGPKVEWSQGLSGPTRRLQAALARRQREVERVTGKMTQTMESNKSD